MSFLLLGFFTGLSLIFAIGAQNVFVIEQGLKKQFVFIVCSICAISDFLLIFLGIFLFHYFESFFTPLIELIFNVLLLLFLLNFIWGKIKENRKEVQIDASNIKTSLFQTIYRTLGFTYLNPHVYSDTVFFLGNFSKNFSVSQKYLFGIGASISSLIFFFALGYLSNYLSDYLKNDKIWKMINLIIILFMSCLAFYVLSNIIK